MMISKRTVARRGRGSRNACAAAAVLSILAGFGPTVDFAADSAGIGNTFQDAKLFVTAPVRWDGEDWLVFAGALAAVGASHALDGRVRSHFAEGPGALNGGQDKNSLRDALPTVAIIGGTWAYAGIIGDSDGYRETWSLVEAGVFSTATGEILSYAAGRERPDGSTSPNRWRAGGDSFPSVHSAAAFAVGTVFAESGNDEYRWVRRIVGYGIASATAYVRVRENVHWLSDTVAGSVLGIATAHFVLNRRDHAGSGSVSVEPTKDGWMVAYSKRFE